jgi:hypothetical protein
MRLTGKPQQDRANQCQERRSDLKQVQPFLHKKDADKQRKDD